MRITRTPLARFIDTSALWSLCLAAWFYYLFERMGRIYPAMLMALLCSGATIALAALIRGRIRLHRRANALAPVQVRRLCEHMALKNPEEALSDIAAWLNARGQYARCRATGSAIYAMRASGSIVYISLISAWPDSPASADALLSAIRRCPISPVNGQCAVASTAPFSAEALALAKRLNVRLIAPEALAQLMHDALPICAETASRTRARDIIMTIATRLSAARMGAWALGLCVSGRILGLEYCRAAGLICAALWIVCVSLPHPPHAGTWP